MLQEGRFRVFVIHFGDSIIFQFFYQLQSLSQHIHIARVVKDLKFLQVFHEMLFNRLMNRLRNQTLLWFTILEMKNNSCRY